MSNQPLVLVTGASGVVGSTGYHAAKGLVARGFKVRAFVRNIDHRTARLEALGNVEIFKGDLLHYESVREAVKGVQRIYFCYPVADGLLKATTFIARAAREEGVKGVVNMSQASTLDVSVTYTRTVRVVPTLTSLQHARNYSHMTTDHWCAESILDWADIGAIHINPYYFMENYLIFPGPVLQRDSTVYVPYSGTVKHYPIAAEDLGVVIAKLIESPEAYIGKRIPLLGPNRGSWPEHYELASKIIGREIKYVLVPVEAWAASSVGKINDYAISHLSGMARNYNDGNMDLDPTVSQLDQFIPRDKQTTITQFLEKNKELFGKRGLQLIFGENE